MWPTITILLSILIGTISAHEIISPVEITTSPGVKSKGFKVVYGDEDMEVLNEVVSDMDKMNVLKAKLNLNEALKPLPVGDVKCLMSVNRYCSKKMAAMKSVLIQAVQEDCAKCTDQEKEDAGRVIATLMAHDPVAWKLFLTRYDGLQKLQRLLG